MVRVFKPLSIAKIGQVPISKTEIVFPFPDLNDYLYLKQKARVTAGNTTVTVPVNHVYLIVGAVCCSSLDSTISVFRSDLGIGSNVFLSASTNTPRWSSGQWTGIIRLEPNDYFNIAGHGLVSYYDIDLSAYAQSITKQVNP